MHRLKLRSVYGALRRTGIMPVASLLLAGCPDGCPNHENHLEIVPNRVAALSGRPFMLRARLTDADGRLMSNASLEGIAWKSGDPSVVISPVSTSPTLVTVSASAPGPVTITAKVAGASASATIVLSTPGTTVDADWAAGSFVDKDPPTVLLVDGDSPLGWRSDSLIAFAGAAVLDEFRTSATPGEVIVFSPNHALQLINPVWTDGCDYVRLLDGAVDQSGVDLTPCPTKIDVNLPPPASVPVQMWSMVTSEVDVAAAIATEFIYAQSKLATGWTGITLDRLSTTISPDGLKQIVLDVRASLGWTCPMTGEYNLLDQLRDGGVDVTTLKPDHVTVIYTQEILSPVLSGDPVPSGYRGYTCPPDPAHGTIVLISWVKRATTTLAHELGHAIGPWVTAPWGHTDGMAGFNASNLMWSYHDPVPAPREEFTLGQAYRLTFDRDAFFSRNAATPPMLTCAEQNQASDIPCPRIAKDVVKR